MKILDRYILKSFLIPFFATFFVVLFVFVMQVLWLKFDDIAGKGIALSFILKFLWYTTLIVVPQALPVGVLLSSIMALGNLSENYEFAANKSAGISLHRMVRPLVFLTIGISVINFFFLNNVYPYAILKQKNLYININKTKPALALVPGSFNTEIPNYQIKFDEKYGKKNNLLKNVIIYDLSSLRGNQKIITSKRGKIVSGEASRYLTLVLNDGHYFESHIKDRMSYNDIQKMPDSNADFDQYTINIDISSFSNENLDDQKYTKIYNMLSLNQLKDTLPVMKNNYDEYMGFKAKRIVSSLKTNELCFLPDSVKKKNLQSEILDNFNLRQKSFILSNALTRVENTISNVFEANKKMFKYKRKLLNFYDIEFYNRVALSFSCLILFFIGAPLGSIIRKGGFGVPMILAIIVYVIFFFANTFGKNLATQSSVTSAFGSWVAVILMAPLGILLTARASKDKGIFDVQTFFQSLFSFFKNLIIRRNASSDEKLK